jgi:hypothetical protein
MARADTLAEGGDSGVGAASHMKVNPFQTAKARNSLNAAAVE